MAKALKREEKKLRDSLKELCFANGIEADTKESAKIYHKLGVIYRKRGSEKLSLLQSAVLLNASISRNPDNVDEVKTDLRRLCSYVVKLTQIRKKDVDLVAVSESIKVKIEAFRQSTDQRLKGITKIPDNAKGAELRDLEELKIKQVLEIQSAVTSEYITIMQNIAEICEELMGKPPCQYAIVGMGALASDEITPYSEFDFMIALEKRQQRTAKFIQTMEYFNSYLIILQIILINLQETSLPTAAVPSVNDFNNPDDTWLIDHFTTDGVTFDGLVNKTCICSVDRPITEMIRVLDTRENLSRSLNQYALIERITKACFVFGDRTTFDSYVKNITIKMRQKNANYPTETLNEQIFHELKRIDTLDNLGRIPLKENCFNSKYLLFHCVRIMIYALARLHNISGYCSFKIIEELLKKGIISENYQHQLSYFAAISFEVRLKICMKKRKRFKDDVNQDHTMSDKNIREIVEAVGKTSLIDFFWTAWALRQDLLHYLSNGGPFTQKVSNSYFTNYGFLVYGSTCYYFQLYHDCIKHATLQAKKAARHELRSCYVHLLACCYDKLDKFKKALKYYQKLIVILKKTSGAEKHSKVAFALVKLSKCYMSRGLFSDAEQYLEEASKLFAANLVPQFNRYAECIVLLSECNLSAGSYAKSLKLLYNHNKEFQDAMCNNKSLFIKVHKVIGLSLHHLDKHEMGMKELHMSFNLSKRNSYKEHVDPVVAEAINNIGVCLMGTGKVDEAWQYFQRNLGIEQRVVLTPPYHSYLQVADWLSMIGACLIELGKKSEGQKELESSVKLRNNAPEEVNIDLAIAYNMGRIPLALRYSDKSLEALAIYEKILEQEKRDIDTSNTHEQSLAKRTHEVGLTLYNCARYKESHEQFVKEIDVLEKLPFTVERAVNIGKCYHYAGACLMRSDQQRNALKCIEKAQEIFDEHGCDDELLAKHSLQYATCLKFLDCHMEALTLHKKALSCFRKLPDASSKDQSNNIKLCISGIGENLLRQGRNAEAIKVFRLCLDMAVRLVDNPGSDIHLFTVIEFMNICRKQMGHLVILPPFVPLINHDNLGLKAWSEKNIKELLKDTKEAAKNK